MYSFSFIFHFPNCFFYISNTELIDTFIEKYILLELGTTRLVNNGEIRVWRGRERN